MLNKCKLWFTFEPPSSGTTDEWLEWENHFKRTAPVRYWLVNTLPDTIRPLQHRVALVCDWCRYRTVRYHVVSSGLAPGYYDKDTLLLNTSFNLLKEYVERELAWMMLNSDEDARWDGNGSKISKILSCNRTYLRMAFRSKELGLEYLNWECNLDSTDSDSQAERAREIRSLYLWWTETRPARVEHDIAIPDDEAYISEYGIMYILSDKFKNDHPDVYTAFTEWGDIHTDQATRWDEEDEANLIRLVKIRQHLWS